MTTLKDDLSKPDFFKADDKPTVVDAVRQSILKNGYEIVEQNDEKPWGAYFRINNSQAEEFVGEFFSGLSMLDARLGDVSAELSPKILLVSPEQRLSWQYHDRRAERWAFLKDGAYYNNMNDEQGTLNRALAGDVVQFSAGERHRLVAMKNAYTIVAEIWQHTNPLSPSNEEDIVRLEDDYSR